MDDSKAFVCVAIYIFDTGCHSDVRVDIKLHR